MHPLTNAVRAEWTNPHIDARLHLKINILKLNKTKLASEEN